MSNSVSLSRNDWSLHRKGLIDQLRHNEKVKEAIKGNLGEIIAEEDIITSDGNKIVKIPIRSLDLPHFRYGDRQQGQVGQGEGGSQSGDVLKPDGGQQAPGQGKMAGDMPGVDYYEAEVTIDELAEMMFEDLSLPNLLQKENDVLEVNHVKFTEVRKKGIMANLDKRRTVLENIRRNALTKGRPVFESMNNDDLRFKTWTTDIKRETNAVIIAMRDVSGSMGEFEKYISRSFYFWMVRFLRKKYNDVKIVFITHHTQAKEVDEHTFFTLGESGGTKVSSAYQLALDVIRERYDPDRWNIYPFHFSDGDNWGDGDNKQCLELVKRLVSQCNIFGYGEIREAAHGTSTLMSAYAGIKDEKFVPVIIQDKKDVYPALRKFFAKREGDTDGR